MRKKKFRLPWFGDSIGKDSPLTWGKAHDFDTDPAISTPRIEESRFFIFYLITFVILLIFLARIFQLTVIAGSKNRELSENNRIKLLEREAKRGIIYDRFGKALAQSRVVYLLEKDGKTTEITADQVKELEQEGLASVNFEGQLGKIRQEVRRGFVLGEAGAHILGYTSEVQKGDLSKFANISMTQSVGRLGLEQTYNEFLTGVVGKKLVEVDTFGKNVSILDEEESTIGRNLYTTIDGEMQKVAYEALAQQANLVGTKKGAVIVQNPNTGEVLALASAPSFDPEDIGKSVADLEKPFFNRATQGSYPPGSVFKIVSALAGLESGQIDENTQIEDVGEFELGGVKFSNWFYNQYGKTDGVIKIKKAIARSNDIFFYRIAQRMGLETLREMSKKFGFGQKTGIDLPNEAVGLVPDEIWKQSAFGENWYLGDTLHLGIGQGFMLTSPVQINSMTAYVATGKLTKPFLVSSIGSDDQELIRFGEKVLADNLASSENLNIVRAGMKDACKPGGTGAPFFNASYDVGCKTGTAEKELGNPHAWFTLYAPFDNPQISVAVLVEDGGEGSSVAAPVAKKIVDWWMANRL